MGLPPGEVWIWDRRGFKNFWGNFHVYYWLDHQKLDEMRLKWVVD